MYSVHQDCLLFFMLLDITQQMYLSMANSVDPLQSETFYKGVIFLNSLRQDFTVGLLHRKVDTPPTAKSLPESMCRWLCRLFLNIPHDPENQRLNDVLLQKAYKEIVIFEYGMLFSLDPLLLVYNAVLFPDFLDWSLTNQELLLSCLSKISEGLHGQSIYPVETFKWMSVLHSQFVQAGLCTAQSLSQLESMTKREGLQSINESPQSESC